MAWRCQTSPSVIPMTSARTAIGVTRRHADFRINQLSGNRIGTGDTRDKCNPLCVWMPGNRTPSKIRRYFNHTQSGILSGTRRVAAHGPMRRCQVTWRSSRTRGWLPPPAELLLEIENQPMAVLQNDPADVHVRVGGSGRQSSAAIMGGGVSEVSRSAICVHCRDGDSPGSRRRCLSAKKILDRVEGSCPWF